MKYSLRSLLVAIVLGITVLLSLSIGVVVVLREQGEMIRDAYCLDWASVLIVQYLDDHDGQYPQNWNDLRQPFEKFRDKSFPFEEIQARIEIDFSANPLDQHQHASRPFVRLKSGRGVSWGPLEPNERIRARITQGKAASL